MVYILLLPDNDYYGSQIADVFDSEEAAELYAEENGFTDYNIKQYKVRSKDDKKTSNRADNRYINSY